MIKATLRLQTLFSLSELMMSQREDVPNMVVSDARVKAKETELLTQDSVTSSVSVQRWFSAPPGAPDRRPFRVTG